MKSRSGSAPGSESVNLEVSGSVSCYFWNDALIAEMQIVSRYEWLDKIIRGLRSSRLWEESVVRVTHDGWRLVFVDAGRDTSGWSASGRESYWDIPRWELFGYQSLMDYGESAIVVGEVFTGDSRSWDGDPWKVVGSSAGDYERVWVEIRRILRQKQVLA